MADTRLMLFHDSDDIIAYVVQKECCMTKTFIRTDNRANEQDIVLISLDDLHHSRGQSVIYRLL
ncbi:hypothetical protein [Parasphingorhabdus sp.]|uniref:hypothetical protein n=1 Tax=Parasphingorhabdus sp. TaxID=2709688 RepID=UPI0032645EB7